MQAQYRRPFLERQVQPSDVYVFFAQACILVMQDLMWARSEAKRPLLPEEEWIDWLVYKFQSGTFSAHLNKKLDFQFLPTSSYELTISQFQLFQL